MKNWQMTIGSRPEWESKRHDGRLSGQVQVAVRSPSKKRAAELFGVSLYRFNDYASETGNIETFEALERHPPETLLIKGSDFRDTVRGQKGWVKA